MKDMHVDEWYTAYLDGSLPNPQRLLMEAHLRDCPRCTAALDDLRLLIGDLVALPQPPMPDGFTAGVRARLTPRPQRRFAWRMPMLAGGALAAAAALVLMISLQTHAPLRDGSTLGRALPKTTPNTTVQSIPDAKRREVTPAPAPVVVTNLPAPAKTHAPRRIVPKPSVSPNAEPILAPAEPVVIAMAPPVASQLKSTNEVPMTFGRNGSDTARLHMEETLDGVTSPAGPSGPAGAPGAPSPSMQSSPLAVLDPAPAAVPDKMTMARKDDDANAMTRAGVPAGDAPLFSLLSVIPKKDAATAATAAAGRDSQARLTPGTARLRVSARGLDRMTAQYAIPASSSQQEALLPRLPAEVALTLPKLPQGAAIRLSLTSRQHTTATESYYLMLPGEGMARDRVTLRLAGAPRLQALLHLAGAGAFSILCPAAFGDTLASFAVADVAPLPALDRLAGQDGHRLEVNGSVINVLPPAK